MNRLATAHYSVFAPPSFERTLVATVFSTNSFTPRATTRTISKFSKQSGVSFISELLLTIVRGFKSLLKGHASGHHFGDKATASVLNTGKMSRLRIVNAINSVVLCVRTIPNLFSLGSPSTVARLVITAVVDAVNTMLRRWFFAHIFKEILKSNSGRPLPSFADLNPCSAISIVVIMLRVRAAVEHATPAIVFRAIFKMPAVPIITSFFTKSFALVHEPIIPKLTEVSND